MALALTIGSATVFAGTGNPSPTGTGQPSQSCGSSGAEMSPPGFNSGGFANADLHYANPTSQGGTASGNGHVVAQYDVACYHFTQAHS